jgi:hypothetical protein
MKARETTSGAKHVAPLKRSTDPRPQLKPQVVQSKSRAAAPHAYRPQSVPKVLQLKRHEVKKLGGVAQPRSPLVPQAQKVFQKTTNLSRPDVHRHQTATTQSLGHVKPHCVQAKTSSRLRNNPLAWSIRKSQPANVIRQSHSIQLAAEAAEAKVEVKLSLADIANKIHVAAGGTGHNTTGVARLKDGKLVVCTQLPLPAVEKQAAKFGITEVRETLGVGYHCEVTLFFYHGKKIAAIGASQGFCPHCQIFLLAKGIPMDGAPRDTPDQVWYCPEHFLGKEKTAGAAYPWAFLLDPITHKRVTYATKAAYEEVEGARLEGIGKRKRKAVVYV